MTEVEKNEKPDPNLWWAKSIIYELYVDKFAGNFKRLTKNLDYFNYLGINTLWLLPFYPSPMVDGGYDVSDYISIRDDLGNMEDFEKFVETAHQKNIRVIIDFVLNHTSDTHPWFIEAKSSKKNPKRDWYIWSDNDNKYSDAFVHFSDVKNSNWIKNEVTNNFYYATFYPQQPDLNWDNPDVYNAMIEAAEFWLSKGVDGFRLDAVSRLIKRDRTNCFALPETHEVLKRMRKDLETKYPHMIFLAESGGWPHEAKTFFGDGDECHIVMNFPLASQLLSAIPDRDLSGVHKVLEESGGICDGCRWGVFLTNHDSVDIFFLHNENQKNKLTQDGQLLTKFSQPDGSSFPARLSEICAGDKDKIIWSFQQLLGLPDVPILYYGNEIGMPNEILTHKPPDSREYVRGDFDWEEAGRQKKDPNSILNNVRKIIQERHKVF